MFWLTRRRTRLSWTWRWLNIACCCVATTRSDAGQSAGKHLPQYRHHTVSPPLFSIITVCFNGFAHLSSTVQSLRSQPACGQFEWVVVDGASTEGSAGWLAGQQPDVFVSEPDRGIYDAMNKGIGLARGQWPFFLNAGDKFADADVLCDVKAAIAAQPGAQIVYGDVLYFGERGSAATVSIG